METVTTDKTEAKVYSGLHSDSDVRGKNLMFDLETLGRTIDSGILEIGWCTFSHLEVAVSPAKELFIPVEQNLLYGFSYESDTIRWWLEKQQRTSLSQFYRNKRIHVTIPQVLSELASQWNELWFDGVNTLWCCGPDFDISILKNAYDKLKVERPIILREENFRCKRDYRTLREMVKDANFFMISADRGNHEAAKDAHAQAFFASEAMSKIMSFNDKINELESLKWQNTEMLQRERQRKKAKADARAKNKANAKRRKR